MGKKPTPSCEYKPLSKETIGILCMLRTEVTDLQKMLENVKSGQTSLQSCADYIKKTMKDISELMTNLLESEYADQIRHLRNLWEQMKLNHLLSKPTDPLEPQDQTCQMDMLKAQFKDIIFTIGYLTIPYSMMYLRMKFLIIQIV